MAFIKKHIQFLLLTCSIFALLNCLATPCLAQTNVQESLAYFQNNTQQDYQKQKEEIQQRRQQKNQAQDHLKNQDSNARLKAIQDEARKKADQAKQANNPANAGQKAKEKEKPTAAASTIREEIQRYMGYEVLPLRYLSLPYDTFMNNNEQGAFIDVGSLLIIFIPIIFLLGFLEKPIKGMIVMGSCFLFLFLSVSVSKIFKADFREIKPAELPNYMESMSFLDSPISYITCSFYNIVHQLNPVGFFERFSGDFDSFTYPMLWILFFAFFFLLQDRMKQKSFLDQTIANFLYLFCFLWLMLTAGILWYGYMMITVGIIFMVGVIGRYYKHESRVNQMVFYAFGGIFVLWSMMSITYRLSNFEPVTPDRAVNMFNAGIFSYQIGRIDDKKVLESFLPNSNRAIDMINRDKNALIYRVGTFFPFFIEKNDKRILSDSQLAYFNLLSRNYPEKEVFAEALKANGYNYILVDLNTHTIDNTPEKSLTKKFQKFMQFIYLNNKLELLSTDRIVKSTTDTNSTVYGVFGEIVNRGTYAVFQIK